MGQNGSDARRGRRQLIQVVPEIVGEVVAPGSASYAAARTLQAMRFATASKPRDQAHQDVSYLQAVEIAANHTIHIVARREAAVRPQASTSRRRPSAGSVVGTVRLELPGASIVEAVVQFAPGSSAASARARQRFLEIGGFATTADLSLLELIDVIDTLAATIVAVATQRAIEWLWMFPRLPVMRLFLAELDELPAYRFALCHDVSSWVESHEQLAALRRLGLKEFETAATARPVVYVARVETLAADLARRLAARANRVEAPQLDERLGEAMLQAYRRVRRDVHRFQHEGHLTERTVLRYCLPPAPTLPTASPLDLDDLRPPQIISRPRTRITPPLSQRTPSIGGPLPPAPAVPSETAEEKSTDFLPYAAVPDKRAAVLDAIVASGGESVATYKRMAYNLLAVTAGMRILDVGCGSGVDLAPLATMAGPTGAIVGLDHDEAVLQAARTRLNLGQGSTDPAAVPAVAIGGTNSLGPIDMDSRAPISVVNGDAEHLPFADATFDRVRADRVLQHVRDPARAVAEMHRVLLPGGIVVLTEPDWKTIAIYPASPQGGDDDRTLAAVLGHYQRTLPHALIGRQLPLLLHRVADPGWEEVSIQAVAFTLPRWGIVDLVMQLTPVARALATEQSHLAGEIEAWLAAIAQADAAGTFWAILPLAFAVARKSALRTTTADAPYAVSPQSP